MKVSSSSRSITPSLDLRVGWLELTPGFPGAANGDAEREILSCTFQKAAFAAGRPDAPAFAPELSQGLERGRYCMPRFPVYPIAPGICLIPMT